MPPSPVDPASCLALESFEYHAWADLMAAAPPGAAGLGLAVAPEIPAVRAPGLPSPEFNRASWRPGQDLDVPAGFLAAAGQHAMLQVAAPFLSSGVEARLDEAGLRPAARDWVMLVRRPGEMAVTDTRLDCRELDAPQAHAAGQVIAAAYGLPPVFIDWVGGLIGRPQWRGFAAFDGNRIVAVAFLFQDGAQAVLTGAATLPQARGLGAQTALIARRIAEASRAGARVIQTHTGLPLPGQANPSLSNLRRAGFQPAHLRRNFLLH